MKLFMTFIRLPSLLAWLVGMGVLVLFMTLIAVPVAGRTMFNPIDGSRLPDAMVFRIGLLGSIFYVLLLRLLLFLVTNSLMYALAPMMRGKF